MKIALGVVSLLVASVLVAAFAQHHRYLETRREIVADRQPIAHSSGALHVVTVLDLAPGQELLAAVRGFANATEAAGGMIVYAGKVVANALVSDQLPQAEWDAFVLAQFPSREVYDEATGAADYRAARERFATSYAMGLRRSPWINAGIPILLLGRRALDVLSGTPARYPFKPATGASPAMPTERRARGVEALLANQEYGENAVVILNFIQEGDEAQQQENSGYGGAMLSLMAEIGNGPMHIGRAVTLEGDADFDTVAIVYYPGVQYFADLLRSEFFTSIIGGKQLADSFSAPTVPLLPHL